MYREIFLTLDSKQLCSPKVCEVKTLKPGIEEVKSILFRVIYGRTSYQNSFENPKTIYAIFCLTINRGGNTD